MIDTMQSNEIQNYIEVENAVDTDLSEEQESDMFKEARPMPLIRLFPDDIKEADISYIQSSQTNRENNAPPAIVNGFPERIAPYAGLGLLYTVWRDGSANVSTAQRIFDYEYTGYKSSNILLTAAHCLFDREDAGAKGACTSCWFYSGYDGGSYIRRHRVEHWRVPSLYADGTKVESLGYDYGFCGLRDFSYDVSDVNALPTNQMVFPVTAYGYPMNIGFGKVPLRIKGQVALDIPTFQGTCQMFGNTFGPGCSGGGWYNEDIPNRLIGINSFLYTDDRTGSMYSPRFNSQFLRSFRNAWESWQDIVGPVPPGPPPPPDPFRPFEFKALS